MSKHPKGLPTISSEVVHGQSLLAGGKPSPLEVVLAYHKRTKHHPYRYAASLGYLDWANQPDPFRRYAGAELTELPFDREWQSPDYSKLYVANAIATEPLSLISLSRLLRHSLALSAWKQSGTSRWPLRVNPSSGNLHPTEAYLVLPAVEGLSQAPGLYHYAPKAHGLEHRAIIHTNSFRGYLPTAVAGCFLIGLASVHWREAWKYGERAFRYCQHDVGHALAAIRIATATLGWDLRVLEGVPSTAIGAMLGVNRNEDFHDAEREAPELLALVDTRKDNVVMPEGGSDCCRLPTCSEYFGQANRLSAEHVANWDVIEEVSLVTQSDGQTRDITPNTNRSLTRTQFATPPEAGEPSAAEVILKRRSAVAMDGSSFLARADFFRMLSRLVPTKSGDSNECANAMPWDAMTWPSRVQLVLMVHRVSGLASGLYALLRSREHWDDLRASLSDKFSWSEVLADGDDLPLYLLTEGNFQEAAAAVSCGQRIASDGAFSVIMLADYRGSLVEQGAAFYRRLFWETGMIGQILYLEAEVAAMRGTGIGCFFDDSVHALLGLRTDQWQSLYHFTVGGPAHDERLQTLPAYHEVTASSI